MKNNGYYVKAIRSDGLIFNYENSDWAITSLEGIDYPTIEVFKEAKGIGNGDIITGKRKGSRIVVVNVLPREYKGGQYRELRGKVIRFHNIAYTYDLEIGYMGEVKFIKDCEVNSLKFPAEDYRTNAELSVSFLSPHAEIFDSHKAENNFSHIEPKWAVKRSYLPGNKMVFSTENRTDSIVVNYKGAVETPAVITINANGYARNLSITLGKEKYLIETELHSGDVIIADTSKSFVKLNEKIISNKDKDLRELKVYPGDNLIEIKAEEGSSFSSKIEYVGRYDGI